MTLFNFFQPWRFFTPSYERIFSWEMSKGDISGCSYLNRGNSSYMTRQALRRFRHLHTTIATQKSGQKWQNSRVKNEGNFEVKKCLADLDPRAQAFAISLGPVVVSAPIKCEPCVYSARGSSRVSRNYQRTTSSRERGDAKCSRCHNRIVRDHNGHSSTVSGVNCVNITDNNGHDPLGPYTVIPHGAFIPRRRILTRKPNQRRCTWTENLELSLDELRLDNSETGSGKSPEVSKTLPSIVLTKSDQVYNNVRQTLDVKYVRLKTPPPSPSVRHIDVHLPS